MRLLPSWRKRLLGLLELARTEPFRWGEWDCAHFTAAAVECLTGQSVQERIPRYRCGRSARKAMRNTLQIFDSVMAGVPQKGHLVEGAVVVFKLGDRKQCGVCVGAGWVATTGQHGMVAVWKPQLLRCYNLEPA